MTFAQRLSIPSFVSRKALRTLDDLDLRMAATEPGSTPSTRLRRLALTLAGLALIGAGIPMLVLPGPGILSMLLGLSLLAGQFAWARQLLTKLTRWGREALTASRAHRRAS